MKKGEMRRQAIVDAAQKLFFARGYDATSVQDVLDALKLSKGGFYHHFESKQQLLEEICRQWVAGSYEEAKAEAENPALSPVDKINLLIRRCGLFAAGDERYLRLLVETAYKGGMAPIRDLLRRTFVNQMNPLMRQILLEGIEKQQLYTAYPEQASRLVLMLSVDVADEIAEAVVSAEQAGAYAEIVAMLNACRRSIEAILNAPYGSVEMLDVGRIAQVAHGLNPRLWSEVSLPAN